jgi:hypothetical protein
MKKLFNSPGRIVILGFIMGFVVIGTVEIVGKANGWL